MHNIIQVSKCSFSQAIFGQPMTSRGQQPALGRNSAFQHYHNLPLTSPVVSNYNIPYITL